MMTFPIGIAFRHGLIGLVLLILPVAEAHAQHRIGVGVLGGVALAKLTIPLELLPEELIPVEGFQISNHVRTGLTGGAFMATPPIARGVTFETGALLSARGTHMKFTVPGFGSAGADLRVIYLDVPALARLGVARWSAGRLFVFAGPTISAKLDARMSVGVGDQSDMIDLFDFPTMDVGFTAGGRFEMEQLLLDVRYTHGLRNLVTGPDAIAGVTVKSRALSIMAGWRFK